MHNCISQGWSLRKFQKCVQHHCLHCPRNFLFLSADTIASFKNALVATPFSTKPLSKWFSVFCNHFYFRISVIGFLTGEIWRASLANQSGASSNTVRNFQQQKQKINLAGTRIPMEWPCKHLHALFVERWDLDRLAEYFITFWKVSVLQWPSLQHVYLQPIELNRTCWKKEGLY